MQTEKKDNLKDISTLSSRRHFLKKAVYTAPVFIVLGQLVKPTNVQAVDSVPPPPPIF